MDDRSPVEDEKSGGGGTNAVVYGEGLGAMAGGGGGGGSVTRRNIDDRSRVEVIAAALRKVLAFADPWMPDVEWQEAARTVEDDVAEWERHRPPTDAQIDAGVKAWLDYREYHTAASPPLEDSICAVLVAARDAETTE